MVLVSAAGMLVVTARRGAIPQTAPFSLASWVPALAGVWMTATHVPLLVDAARGRVEWAAALFHAVPGVLVLAAALVATAWAWKGPADAATRTPGSSPGPPDRAPTG